jgi:hypothetical protein
VDRRRRKEQGPRARAPATDARRLHPHPTTKKDKRVGQWAEENNVEIACTPTNSSWLNRVEAQFTALREFTRNGTNHGSHREQGSLLRRYIAWRNRNTDDERLRRIVKRSNVA